MCHYFLLHFPQSRPNGIDEARSGLIADHSESQSSLNEILQEQCAAPSLARFTEVGQFEGYRLRPVHKPRKMISGLSPLGK
jgi:hypothetical protein